MSIWERARVEALAPDAASTVAAQRLVRQGRLTHTGCTGRALWARCVGSGRQPYETVVDLAAAELTGEPACTCTCPSRKLPCKHALALMLSWSTGGLSPTSAEPDFAADLIRSRDDRRAPGSPGRPAAVVDPEAVARRTAARQQQVNAGLDELELWLHDQIRGGLAAVERAGYAHFDRIAARMVDAQAPGIAGMLRSMPAELAADGWPPRLLERLGGLHLLCRAHRRIDDLPPELAANVRSRVGYPVAKAEVLLRPGVRDRWVALGMVDTVEYQLETRRVWLYGTSTRRWAMWLTFAPPGASPDTSVRPGQLLDEALHFYPGSGFRALIGETDGPESDLPALGPLAGEDFSQARGRMAQLLALDPWAGRLPALVSAAPVTPGRPAGPWRVRDGSGACVELVGLAGDPWRLLARSGGEPVDIFGEWTRDGFRPLSLLPDRDGQPFSTELVA